jgi:Family of unknown function (DUF6599)
MKSGRSAVTRRRFVAGAVALTGLASQTGCKGKKSSGGEKTRSGARIPPPGPTMAPASSAPPRHFSTVAAILPQEVDGYRRDGNDGHYDRDTLFELINGGAEVFLALNFRAAVSRRYSKPGAPELIVDVFDMASSSDAYGAYHHDMREGPSAGFGHESELGGSSLFFWKDRYYVSVVAFASTDASREAVVAVGKAVADGIKNLGEMPGIVGLLPKRGLVTSQVHYFHTWQLLNRHYDFGKDDLLKLGADTEGVLARYRHEAVMDAGRMPAVLLVQYPTVERAERGHRRFVEGYLSGAREQVVRTERGWVALRRRASLLIGVVDAASLEEASDLLMAVEQQRKGEK